MGCGLRLVCQLGRYFFSSPEPKTLFIFEKLAHYNYINALAQMKSLMQIHLISVT